MRNVRRGVIAATIDPAAPRLFAAKHTTLFTHTASTQIGGCELPALLQRNAHTGSSTRERGSAARLPPEACKRRTGECTYDARRGRWGISVECQWRPTLEEKKSAKPMSSVIALLQSIARACLCVLGRPMARTPIGLFFSPVLIPPPPLFVCLHV